MSEIPSDTNRVFLVSWFEPDKVVKLLQTVYGHCFIATGVHSNTRDSVNNRWRIRKVFGGWFIIRPDDGRSSCPKSAEDRGWLDNVDMFVEMARQTIASRPDNRLVAISVLPNVVFLKNVRLIEADTIGDIKTYRVEHLLNQTDRYP